MSVLFVPGRKAAGPIRHHFGWRRAAAPVTLLAGILAMTSPAQADPLQAVLKDLMDSSPRLAAAKADWDAANGRASETWRKAWTPQLDLSFAQGYQNYQKPDAATRFYDARTSSAQLTQLIYDFGKSSSSVAEADAVAAQNQVAFEAVGQGLLLEAVTAFISVQRAQQVLRFARDSEANIREQTQLENALVESGKGYASNVLQAKAQLAGASARRVRAEGALEVAQARVRAVFGVQASRLSYKDAVAFPEELLPTSRELAHELALKNNLQIALGQLRSDAIKERKWSTTASEFAPRIELVGEASRDFNSDGTRGMVDDRKAMVQVSLPLNVGLGGVAAVEAVTNELLASRRREDDTRDLVLEQVDIAWRNLLTAKENMANLSNQMNIATQFLEIARQERQVGRRTLLDVLTAETNLINAQSDYISTTYDLSIASYTLLQAIGQLEVSSIREDEAKLHALPARSSPLPGQFVSER
ncbi:TolC family protein [Magnetospirillum sp. SS-4]|uniref:TolC family protein n=1 Tax=Magnetospirillum sp. SS-4 TaxID=2681465 RepID=UPI001573D333|nr:TolC family protein [Magnetospirillum sp. SS-4]